MRRIGAGLVIDLDLGRTWWFIILHIISIFVNGSELIQSLPLLELSRLSEISRLLLRLTSKVKIMFRWLVHGAQFFDQLKERLPLLFIFQHPVNSCIQILSKQLKLFFHAEHSQSFFIVEINVFFNWFPFEILECALDLRFTSFAESKHHLLM